MNAVHLSEPQPARVLVHDDGVRIVDLIVTDLYFRRVVAAAADPVEAAQTICRVGGQAVELAGPNLDAQVVGQAFDGLVRNFDSLLGATFDADSRSSVIAKIVDAVDPDKPDSPGGKGTRQILDAIKEVLIAVTDSKARAQVTELTAIKGFAYEDVVDAGLAPIVFMHGDILERVAKTTGLAGSQKGDHLITISAEDTCGLEARILYESKDRDLSMTKTMNELSAGMVNHGAQAAVAVFSRTEHAPREVRQFPFWWSGNRAVVIYDKDCPDEDALALRLSYEWARWVCRRDLTVDGSKIDSGRVEALLTRTRQALARQKSARACFTQAKNQIDEGERHVADLVDDVRAAIDDLSEELNKN
ncbi:MAG: hypothetical protein J2P28_01115 [Actinobacteria bacterium]|nr:hypothetical protein [Actinomycetota bacterium]MBO0834101.1 hypothetical protein [Actinomycetota bacterium]